MNAITKQMDEFKAAALHAEDNPQWFFTDVLGFPALDWQLDAINAVFDVRRKIQGRPTIINHKGLCRITIRSCHGTGKTQVLALLMHIWNFTTFGKIACTAPKEAQLTRRLWPRYRGAMAHADQFYRKNIKVKGMDIDCFGDPDWGAIAETASDPDNLAGYHDDPQLFLIDEASAKRLDPMFPVIEGALTTLGSVSVEIGNPTRTEGEFYNHHCKRGVRDLYFKFHIKQEDAPELVSKEWVDTMIKKYGANSPITLIRAMGEFAAFDEYLLIPMEYIESSLDSEEYEDGSHPTIRVSIDVADGGGDSTVITVCKVYQSYRIVLSQKQFYFNAAEAPIKAAEAGLEMFKGYGGDVAKGDDFVVDSIGCGSGTAGYLMKLNQNVVVYKGGEKSDSPSVWRNRRVQSYMALYEAFAEGAIISLPNSIDDEDEYRSHLLSIKRNKDNEKVDDIEPKRRIKQAGLPSPDRADSLAMQYATQSPNYANAAHFTPETFGHMESANYDA